MKVKYAYMQGQDTDTTTPTKEQIEEGSSLLDIETTGLGNTVFNLGESTAGKAAKGGFNALGAISSVAGPVMEGGKEHTMNREVGKQIAKSGNVDISKEAKERLKETYDQMQDLVKEADGMNWKAPLAATVAGAAGGAATQAGIKGISNLVRSRKAEKTWDQLKEEHPDLANEETREHFDVVKQFAPDLATNPSTARSFLKRMKRTGMAPHEFVDRLTQTQGNIEKGRMSGDIADAASSGLQSGMPSFSDVQKAQHKKQSSGLQQELNKLDPR